MTALVLHDLGGDARQLAQMLPELPDVWAPDLPGHGANALPADAEALSIYRLAQQVAQGMPQHATGSPLTIIGLGLGAAVGLRIALSGVFRMDRFVAIRPSFNHQTLPEHLTIYPVLADLLGTTTYGAGIEQVMAKLVTTGIYNDIRQSSRAAAAEVERQVMAPGARERRMRLAEIPMHPAFEAHEFTNLDLPSMVIADPTDPVHPIGVAEQWTDLLGAAQHVTPDRGRDPHSADAWIRHQLDAYLVGVR